MSVTLYVFLNSFNCVRDNPAVLIVWHLRKVDPRLEVLLSVTAAGHTVCVTSWGGLSGPYLGH